MGLYGGQPTPGCCARCTRWQGAKRAAPARSGEPLGPESFDGVYVINLGRRPDRMKGFHLRIAEARWPFAWPERFDAVDGQILTPPESWGSNTKGAWGIAQSHRGVLRRCLDRGQKNVLIFEDDALFPADFASQVTAWLSRVPSDWDGLFLGGQHTASPVPITPEVLRCRVTVCMHAYALREPLISDLLQYLEQTQKDQCDWSFAELVSRYRVYAPARFLVGQAADHSDNTGFKTTEQWWHDHQAVAGGAVPPGGRELLVAAASGLGTQVEAVAAKLGADQLANAWEWLTGRRCRCAARKAWLNARWPGGWKQLVGLGSGPNAV